MGINDFVKLGDKLKSIRDKLGLTQAEMADKLNLKRSTYANYESNKREPNSETLNQICDILGIGFLDIFSETIKNFSFTDEEYKQEEKDSNLYYKLFELISIHGIDSTKKQLNTVIEHLEKGYLEISHREASIDELISIILERIVSSEEMEALFRVISIKLVFNISKEMRTKYFNNKDDDEIIDTLSRYLYEYNDLFYDDSGKLLGNLFLDVLGLDKIFDILDNQDQYIKELEHLDCSKDEISKILYKNFSKL
ncbi:TPA: helix-turn-helix transcriptional regulator [Clostridioides difficile]|uniref:helix-turn-helix domain-containing protein n=1 Tax=Clostridioides difficile TaxID=1496 RepID=UPI0003B299CC|nr:helix-turn-helix transcriptional regulator [Clostridioides difficile]MBJ9769294.1 helix-turn-helix transcriptional regulator [Clostridioides difficile]MCE0686051.1 helix-turn-helix domain-containing protein [Clostridioides difficile]MCE0713352.1 helix-turn-helix domain-containing protein [Clostridioides difficile]MCE0720776.1 helix-turn-helix domain-containing protein [Clostridioides difficile]MCE0730286.1 helix-turn-helix domain-containing protein [Clostridioides difficile]